MEIRTPIIAILVSTILLVIYLRRNLPQLISARVFFVFLVTVFFSNLCEIYECAVFMYSDESRVTLRHSAQILYIGSLLFTAFIMCIYVYFKTSKKRMLSNTVVALTALPMVLAIINAIVNGVFYGVSENGNYFNYGVAVDVCYIVGFIYIFLSLIRVIVLRGRLPKEEFIAFVTGLTVWVFLALSQFFNRSMQVSAGCGTPAMRWYISTSTLIPAR